MQVSNDGQLTVMIVPLGGIALGGLIAHGNARPARTSPRALIDHAHGLADVVP